MSYPFATAQTTNYQGSLNSVPSTSGPPQEPAREVNATINFSNYPSGSGVIINLALIGGLPAPVFSAIRTVKIDNTFNPVSVYVFFPDTLDVVLCPAFGLVRTRVATNGLTCTVFLEPGTATVSNNPVLVTLYNIDTWSDTQAQSRSQVMLGAVSAGGADGSLATTAPQYAPICQADQLGSVQINLTSAGPITILNSLAAISWWYVIAQIDVTIEGAYFIGTPQYFFYNFNLASFQFPGFQFYLGTPVPDMAFSRTVYSVRNAAARTPGLTLSVPATKPTGGIMNVFLTYAAVPQSVFLNPPSI